MDTQTINLILDFVLVAASIWMVFMARGIGGIVGKGLGLIVVGAIVLGLAHLLATFGSNVLLIPGPTNNLIHRVIVLAGFILLGLGFRQMVELKR
jgi:hypothetical protein